MPEFLFFLTYFATSLTLTYSLFSISECGKPLLWHLECYSLSVYNCLNPLIVLETGFLIHFHMNLLISYYVLLCVLTGDTVGMKKTVNNIF